MNTVWVTHLEYKINSDEWGNITITGWKKDAVMRGAGILHFPEMQSDSAIKYF